MSEVIATRSELLAPGPKVGAAAVEHACTGEDTGVAAGLNVVISMYLARAKAAKPLPSAASPW